MELMGLDPIEVVAWIYKYVKIHRSYTHTHTRTKTDFYWVVKTEQNENAVKEKVPEGGPQGQFQVSSKWWVYKAESGKVHIFEIS